MSKIQNIICYNNRQIGFITLLSVLVVGAVGVAITISLILLGLGSARTSFAYEQMHQAKALAGACAEEALERVREVDSFVGSDNLTLGLGTCTYSISSQGESDRLIDTTGTVGTVIRKIKISLSGINPVIVIDSWQEVP